jgi:RecA-family ATPase
MEKFINAIAKELQDNKSSLYECEIDLSKDYPQPKYLLYQSDVGTFPRGDIQAIKAKSKNGKSYLCSIFIASVLGNKDFQFESKENNLVVIYFDTEQNARNTASLVRRVHAMLHWDCKTNHEGFCAFALREKPISERLSIIEDVISKRKPLIVFIDGIADLIENFNDVEQSTDLINELMKVSSSNDCCVCCVLHTNKAKDDSGMKGHLGTMLLQKSSDVFEVKKSDDTFNVTETDCRNLSIEDFAFCIDEHGIPYKTNTIKETNEQQKVDAIKKTLDEVFVNDADLGYNELVSKYALYGVCCESTAKRRINKSKDLNLIKVNEKGKYCLGYARGSGITPYI